MASWQPGTHRALQWLAVCEEPGSVGDPGARVEEGQEVHVVEIQPHPAGGTYGRITRPPGWVVLEFFAVKFVARLAESQPIQRPVPNLQEQHAFLDAAKRRDIAAVRATVERTPAIVNVTPSGRWSVLHQFAQAGDEATVRFLLEHGADLAAKTKDGQTPLAVADAKCWKLLGNDASRHSFETTTFAQPTYCEECQQFLWGLTLQGQLCTYCRRTVCHSCAATAYAGCIGKNNDGGEVKGSGPKGKGKGDMVPRVPQEQGAAPAGFAGLASRVAGESVEMDECKPQITGVMRATDMSIMEAAIHTGLADMDTYGYMSQMAGDTLAEGDPHGLTGNEAGGFNLYSTQSEFYPSLNQKLRDQDQEALKPYFPALKLMELARRKLPPIAKTLYRGVKGVSLAQKFATMREERRDVTWWSMTSTTDDLGVMQSDMFLGNTGVRTLFIIEAKKAVDIKRYAYYPEESEFLLFPGTTLHIKTILDQGGGLTIVALEEIEFPVSFFN